MSIEINYGISMIMNDTKKIVGVRVITLKSPEEINDIKEVSIATKDVYDGFTGIDNITVRNGKIQSIHGAIGNYNTLSINGFGHVTPVNNTSITVLCKIGEKYIVANAYDKCIQMTDKQIEFYSKNNGKVCNVAIESDGVIRPIASAGFTHDISEVKVRNSVLKEEETVRNRVQNWVHTRGNRCLLLDIDGTLTDKSGAVPKQMINILTQINELPRTYVVLSTGRILEHELSKSIKSNIVALGNGSIIFNKGKLVASRTLDANEGLKVTEFARKNKLACQTYDPERRLIVTRSNKYQHDDPEAKNPNNTVIEVDKHTLQHCSITPKVLISVNPEYLQKAYADVESIVDTSKCNVMITTRTTVEVVPKNADKKLSVDMVCQVLGITPNEIISIGDNDNDIPMLKAAGLAFVVSNGSSNTKQVADRVLTRPMWEGSYSVADTLLRAYYKMVRVS